MAKIEKKNCYVLTLSEEELHALWFHLKYGLIEDDLDEPVPLDADDLHEEIYQVVRKMLNKN